MHRDKKNHFMKTSLLVRFKLLVFVTVAISSNAFAQDSPQWELPDGAKARLGKGVINEIQYSPDGYIDLRWLAGLVFGSTIRRPIKRPPCSPGICLPNLLISVPMETLLLVRMAALSDSGTPIRAKSCEPPPYRIRSKALRSVPGGRAIATSTIWDFAGDGDVVYTIRLLDANTGELLQTLSGHSGIVDSVSFSPDGRTVASGGWDHYRPPVERCYRRTPAHAQRTIWNNR